MSSFDHLRPRQEDHSSPQKSDNRQQPLQNSIPTGSVGNNIDALLAGGNMQYLQSHMGNQALIESIKAGNQTEVTDADGELDLEEAILQDLLDKENAIDQEVEETVNHFHGQIYKVGNTIIVLENFMYQGQR